MNIKNKTKTLRSLIAKRDDLERLITELRAEIRNSIGLGQHDDVTVYAVKSVRVKSHTRRGFTAIRVNR